MGVKEECIIPSKECDRKVQDYCNSVPNDKDFCGCSTNVLKDVPDPALGNLPTMCWAKSCTQNPNAYQFYFTQTYKCPDVCIDQSTITALGSNITESSFNQASCGANIAVENNDENTKTLSELYQYILGLGITTLVSFIILLSSMSIVVVLI